VIPSTEATLLGGGDSAPVVTRSTAKPSTEAASQNAAQGRNEDLMITPYEKSQTLDFANAHPVFRGVG